jgi:hypothetical protein
MCLVQISNTIELPENSTGLFLAHFHAHSQQWVIWCSEVSCEKLALVGCLVHIYEDSTRGVYVVPLCYSHAISFEKIDIGSVIPVPKDI